MDREGAGKGGAGAKDAGETEVEAKIRGMLEALASRFEACSIREHREAAAHTRPPLSLGEDGATAGLGDSGSAAPVVPLWVPPSRGAGQPNYPPAPDWSAQNLSPGDRPHSQWLTVPAVSADPPVAQPPTSAAGLDPASIRALELSPSDDEEIFVFVPKGVRPSPDLPQQTAGGGGGGGGGGGPSSAGSVVAGWGSGPDSGGSWGGAQLGHSLGLVTQDWGLGGGFGAGCSPSVAGEGPWAGGTLGMEAGGGREEMGVGGGGEATNEVAQLRQALDTVVEFSANKESRAELTRSVVRGGVGAELLVQLVQVSVCAHAWWVGGWVAGWVWVWV